MLSAAGKQLYDIRLRHQGSDGNGIGVPAAPSIADLDGDGRLEIVLSTFDHGLDVYRVPGSGTNCLPWPTGRGNLLRNGDRPGDGLTRRYSTASTCVGVGDQVVDRHHLERPRVRRAEHHRRRAAGVVGLEPARRAHAPAVAGREPGEAPFRARRGEVVAGDAR